MGWNDHVIDIIRQGRKRSDKQAEVVKEGTNVSQTDISVQDERPKETDSTEKVEKPKKQTPQEPIDDSESE